MLLAIDVGNSHIVIGCFDGAALRHVFRVATDARKTEDEYFASLRQLLSVEGFEPRVFRGAVLSCVVPPLTGVFRAVAQKLTGLDALVVGAPDVVTGLKISIPDQLAGDMIAVAAAAAATCPHPVIMADLGTATKICVIDAHGAYIGGAICPGVQMSADTLSSGAALLPRVSIEAPESAIRGDTVGAMRSGIVFGAAAMLDGMIQRFEAELGAPAAVVATGGLAARITPHCRRAIELRPNLLLEGLRILYERNS